MLVLFKIFIGIISFIIVYHIFKRKNKKTNPLKNWKFYLIWFLTCIIIFSVISISIVSFLFYKYSPPSRDFNTEEWNNNTSKRNELVKDLIDSEILEEKNRSQVISLLGEKYAYINNTKIIEYYICPGRGFLSLDCDIRKYILENDKVDSYEIIQG